MAIFLRENEVFQNAIIRLPTEKEWVDFYNGLDRTIATGFKKGSKYAFNLGNNGNHALDGCLFTNKTSFEGFGVSYGEDNTQFHNVIGNISKFLMSGACIGGSWDSERGGF